MVSFLQILYMVIGLYMYVLIGSAILSWLLMFNVVNARNEFVRQLGELLQRLTEPALRPIRRFVPTLNGVDLSYMVLFFGLMFIRLLIQNNFPVW